MNFNGVTYKNKVLLCVFVVHIPTTVESSKFIKAINSIPYHTYLWSNKMLKLISWQKTYLLWCAVQFADIRTLHGRYSPVNVSIKGRSDIKIISWNYLHRIQYERLVIMKKEKFIKICVFVFRFSYWQEENARRVLQAITSFLQIQLICHVEGNHM